MSATVADLNPKTLENAKRQFVELYGSALVMNTYLKIALVLVSLVALGLLGLNFHTAAKYSQVKPLVIRIDDVGRAEAVQYDATGYQPQPPELRYFLTQFIVKHFSRLRATVQREYPDSLFFLEPALADATIAQNEQSRVLETFLTNPSADEVDIVVQNVSLSELTKPPFKASVSFQKCCIRPARGRNARARRTSRRWISSLRDHVPNEFVRVNPLGLQVTYFRVDQAFEEAQAMIANVAFLAALTTFLVVAWLAGELTFLAPYKAGHLPAARADRSAWRSWCCSSTCAPLYYSIARGCSCATPAGSCRTWTGNSGSKMLSCETSIGT